MASLIPDDSGIYGGSELTPKIEHRVVKCQQTLVIPGILSVHFFCDVLPGFSLRGCELAQSRSRRRGRSPSAPSSLNNGMGADIDRSVLQVYSISGKTMDLQCYE